MNRDKTDWKFWIIFLAAAAVFLFAAVRLGMLLWEYHTGSREYQSLEESVGFLDEDMESLKEDSEFTVDFDRLQKMNPDVAGWIRMDKLGISYPIVQGKDNEYYLSHTFSGKENKCGSIFIETGNQKDFSDFNTFVYGHNMKDQSMFAKLNQFQDEGTFRENPEFYIYTVEGVRRYKIYSCYVATLGGESFLYQSEDEINYARWQEMVREKSLYDTGVVPDMEQKTVTLMTCTPAGDKYRFLVHGALVEEKEER